QNRTRIATLLHSNNKTLDSTLDTAVQRPDPYKYVNRRAEGQKRVSQRLLLLCIRSFWGLQLRQRAPQARHAFPELVGHLPSLRRVVHDLGGNDEQELRADPVVALGAKRRADQWNLGQQRDARRIEGAFLA